MSDQKGPRKLLVDPFDFYDEKQIPRKEGTLSIPPATALAVSPGFHV
jgi:hypothetical protein